MRRDLMIVVLACAVLATGVAAQDGLSPADRGLAREVFKQLIEINTTDSLGNTPWPNGCSPPAFPRPTCAC